MLLIEMEGRGPGPFHLEFHPRVTVVTGLGALQRQQLARTLHDLLVGNASGIVASVDVGGEPQDLTADLLARLGLLREPIENVISAADLPGARVRSSGSEQSASTSTLTPAAPAVHTPPPPVESSPLEMARAELQEAQQRADELAEMLDVAKGYGPTVSEEEYERAQYVLDDARTRVLELNSTIASLPKPEQQAQAETKAERLERLREQESAIARRLQELTPSEAPQADSVDTSTIEQLLPRAREAVGGDPIDQRRRRLRELKEEWLQRTEALERLARQQRPPKWLVDQTKEQLEEAQARITAFTYQLQEGIDVRKPLERARRQLEEAKLAWDEIENGVEGEVIAAQHRLDEIVVEIGEFLRLEPGFFVPGVLQQEQDRLAAQPEPDADLAAALTEFGVVFEPGGAIEAAERWVREQEEQAERRKRVQQEVATALIEQGDLRAQIQALENEPDDVDADDFEARLKTLRADLEAALQAESRAAETLTRLAQRRSAQPTGPSVESLQKQYEEALTIVDAAGRKVDYFARLSALRHEAHEQLGIPDAPVTAVVPPAVPDQQEFAVRSAPEVEPEPPEEDNRPWWERRAVVREATTATEAAIPDEAHRDVDVSGVTDEDLEFYVLARAATLRMVGRNEPVPLILNGTFDDIPARSVTRVLDALAKISSLVQVIYLSSGNVAEQWVDHQSELLAATVSVTPR